MAAVTLPSQLPYTHYFFVYSIVNIREFMEFLYLIFYACVRLRFLDVEPNPGLRRPVPDVQSLPQDDRIFDCLLISMAAVQAEDVRASFLFVGDLNAQDQEWFGSITTNRHGVAAFDFATVPGCDQLVVGPPHARGGTLDLLITDVPDLVQVSVVAPISDSDHS